MGPRMVHLFRPAKELRTAGPDRRRVRFFVGARWYERTMPIHNITAGARASTRLVHDDRDHFELSGALDRCLGQALLAFCPMNTHLHVLAEGERSAVLTAVDYALRSFAHVRNRREACPELLRGPIDARTLGDDTREI